MVFFFSPKFRLNMFTIFYVTFMLMFLLHSVNGVIESHTSEPKKVKTPSEWIGTIKPKARPNDHVFNKVNDAIFEERPHTPNRQRVAPGKVAEYDLAKQKVHTYDRLDKTYSLGLTHGSFDSNQKEQFNSGAASIRASKNKNIAKAAALLPQH